MKICLTDTDWRTFLLFDSLWAPSSVFICQQCILSRKYLPENKISFWSFWFSVYAIFNQLACSEHWMDYCETDSTRHGLVTQKSTKVKFWLITMLKPRLFPVPGPPWCHKCLESHWNTCVPSPWQLGSRPLGGWNTSMMPSCTTGLAHAHNLI